MHKAAVLRPDVDGKKDSPHSASTQLELKLFYRPLLASAPGVGSRHDPKGRTEQ